MPLSPACINGRLHPIHVPPMLAFTPQIVVENLGKIYRRSGCCAGNSLEAFLNLSSDYFNGPSSGSSIGRFPRARLHYY